MFTFMKMSLVLLLSSVMLPLVNGVTSCKLFHKKDKWHNWSKLYYSWIKLTLITMYKSSFLNINWNDLQLWKLVCFIMQLKWDSTTTYPKIVKKKMVLQRKYPKLCIISLYIIYVNTFAKSNFCAIKNHIALSCHVISFIDFARVQYDYLLHRNYFLLINMLENGMSRVFLLANRNTVK
jgi:hypothetical protein